MSLRALPTLRQVQARLELVFPRAAFDPVLSNPLAAAAVTTMIYVDAIVPAEGALPNDAMWARPSMCLWLADEVYARADDASRLAWRAAAQRGKRQVEELQAEWEIPFRPRYADNTRETLRDETLPAWAKHGAVRTRPGVKTTSSRGRWALADAFADLFDPSLEEGLLAARIDAWRHDHMSPGARLKALTVQRRDESAHAIVVQLPDGSSRSLEPGDASAILKGVIEEWAPTRLRDPVVLTISEPGDKLYVADAALIERLELAIDVGTLLPDAVIVDIGMGPPQFWIVEVVATDGPIDEERKRSLLRWADSQQIPVDSCQFLTAFASRNAGPARRRLKDLATGTYAWYADEPFCELAWCEIARAAPLTPASGTARASSRPTPDPAAAGASGSSASPRG